MQYIFVCTCSISALKSHYFFSKKTKHWPEQVNALIWLTQCIVLTDTMHRLYFANESPFIPQWIAFTLRRKRLSFFNGTRMSSEWWAVSDEGVGTLRAASEVSYSHNSRQSRQRLRAIIWFCEIRERAIITQCAFRTLHADVPTPLTTLLRRICYSLFLSIRVCDPKTKNMFLCSSVKGINLRSSVVSVLSVCHHLLFVKKQEKRILEWWGKIEDNATFL